MPAQAPHGLHAGCIRAHIRAHTRAHTRTVPDWPAPGVQFRDITPLLQNPKVFRVLVDEFVHRYFNVRPDAIAALDARTIDDIDLGRLRDAGATELVPEAIEGSLMLVAQALALVGVPMARVNRLTCDARDARYPLPRGYFHGADDDTIEERAQACLASVTLPAAAACLGHPLVDQALHAIGVNVLSVRRANRVVDADDAQVLASADTLVLSGLPEPLSRAGAQLLRG